MNAVEIALAIIAKHKEEAEAAQAAEEEKKEQFVTLAIKLPKRLLEPLQEIAAKHDLRTIQGPQTGELSVYRAAVHVLSKALEPKEKPKVKRQPKDYCGERINDRICLARIDNQRLLVQCLVCNAMNTLSDQAFLRRRCKTCVHRERGNHNDGKSKPRHIRTKTKTKAKEMV